MVYEVTIYYLDFTKREEEKEEEDYREAFNF